MHRNVRITRGGGKTLTQGGGFQNLVWLMFRLPGGFISSIVLYNIPYFGEGIPIWWLANLSCIFPPYFLGRLVSMFFGWWLKASATEPSKRGPWKVLGGELVMTLE